MLHLSLVYVKLVHYLSHVLRIELMFCLLQKIVYKHCAPTRC